MSIKPMHQTGAFVLKESVVLVRSRVSCNVQRHGWTLRSRLQVMGRAVRQPPNDRSGGMRHVRICIPYLVAALVGCSSKVSDDMAPYTIVDSAGVRIVESHLPTWGAAGRQIDPEPTLRIGQVEGEEAYEFGSLRDGALLTNGHIAVSDGLANQVRIFDSAGRHLSTLGKAGDGPGEFRGLSSIWEYRGDSIAAFDGRLQRTSVFSRSSGLFRTVQNPSRAGFAVLGLVRDGPFILVGRGLSRSESLQGTGWDSAEVVALDLSGSSSEVILRLPVNEVYYAPSGLRERVTAHGVSLEAIADDGFYWATSDRYEITYYDAAGTVRRILRRHVQPVAIDESMKAEYEAAVLAEARQHLGGEAARIFVRNLENAQYAETLPLFGSAFVDRDQRLWVSEWAWPALTDPPPPLRWSVFSADGHWLGDLEAPDRLRIVDSRGDIVLGIWRDDFDVQYVQLHQIISH